MRHFTVILNSVWMASFALQMKCHLAVGFVININAGIVVTATKVNRDADRVAYTVSCVSLEGWHQLFDRKDNRDVHRACWVQDEARGLVGRRII